MKKKKRKYHLKRKNALITIILIFSVLIFYLLFFKNTDAINVEISNKNVINPQKNERKSKEEKNLYELCTKNQLPLEEYSDEMNAKKDELIKYINKFNISYEFDDLTHGFSIKVNEDKSMYGASLIKLVTAIYLLENNEDLDKTITYTGKYTESYSDYMSKVKIGTNVTLRDLIKYSISASDNTAHHMLFDYIGRDNLRAYAKGLGAKYILTGKVDRFGNQSASDMTIYLKKAYEIINNNPNGNLLKEAMLNNKRNNLTVKDSVTIAHKYGKLDPQYFHDVGINLDEHPYTISVLTTVGYVSGGSVINKISRLTKEYSDLYYSKLDTYCKNYSKEKD